VSMGFKFANQYVVSNPKSRSVFVRRTVLSAVFLAILGLVPASVAQVSTDDPSLGLPSGPQPYQPSLSVKASPSEALRQALSAAKSKNFGLAESLRQGLSDPMAKKLVQWAIINNEGNIYGFAALDGARRDLWGWPRETRRQIAAEKQIQTSALTPQQTIDWFSGAPPQTIEGASALIGAYEASNRLMEAEALAKSWWRDQAFDLADQDRFFARFSRYLKAEDHKVRLNTLLLGTQGPASRALFPLVDDQTRQVATAAIALRSGTANATGLYEAANLASPRNPVLAYERGRFLRRAKLETLGYQVLADLPQAPLSEVAIDNLWAERVSYFRHALSTQNYRAAYEAMKGAGFPNGEKKAESEFFAGWMALVKLNRPNEALSHFKNVKAAGTSPITQSRAYYWMGRAYEAMGDKIQAKSSYESGGQFIYAFYGQLAAEKAGLSTITLTKDPIPTEADKIRFANRDMVKAAKLLGEIGDVDLFRALILALDDVLPNSEEQTLLVDMAARYDSQDLAMRVARVSQQRGFYLPERAYPLRAMPAVRLPDPAFVLAITRQESGFDPNVRSHANARGMMQLIPPTARGVARRLGLSYSDAKLYEPEYNMMLGAYHLGELVDQFGGSFVLASAGYNAGPGRPAQWIGIYGDPRGANSDPLSFIESAPFTETRNYMMRVMENFQVYKARLNGGTAKITPMADLQRGMMSVYVPETPQSGDLPSGPIKYNDLKSKTP
jgi:soluble lytic murein transglycosylase